MYCSEIQQEEVKLQANELTEKLATILRERPSFFAELLREYSKKVDYRTFLLGWSELRTRYQLDRDSEGRYLLKP